GEDLGDLRLVIHDEDLHTSSFVKLTTTGLELLTKLQGSRDGQPRQILVMIACRNKETNGTVRAFAFIRMRLHLPRGGVHERGPGPVQRRQDAADPGSA